MFFYRLLQYIRTSTILKNKVCHYYTFILHTYGYCYKSTYHSLLLYTNAKRKGFSFADFLSLVPSIAACNWMDRSLVACLGFSAHSDRCSEEGGREGGWIHVRRRKGLTPSPSFHLTLVCIAVALLLALYVLRESERSFHLCDEAGLQPSLARSRKKVERLSCQLLRKKDSSKRLLALAGCWSSKVVVSECASCT